MKTLKGVHFKWVFLETDKIGSGGNSIVYKAHREDEPNQKFALKLFNDSANSDKKRARFLREITVVESLKDIPGCSNLIDYGVDGDVPFYVMPYYSGGDLYQKFIKHPQSPVMVAPILKVFLNVIETLCRLHAEPTKLAVRDLKPQNILLTGENEPVICDFGLALWSGTPDEDRLTTQRPVGSSGYRPPEWHTAYPESDHTPGDIWSLGRTIWAVFASKSPPANYESLGTTGYHLKNWIENSYVATAVQGIVNQCTNSNPAKRPSAQELLEIVKGVLSYCTNASKSNSEGSLEERLSGLSVRLPGSDVIANAAQKKAELDAKFNEIDDSQKLLIEKLREFIPKLSAAVPESMGKFGVFGRSRQKKEYSWEADAYIVFFPDSSLVETGLGREVTYTFGFGLNSNSDFAWYEVSLIEGHRSEHSYLNPKSLNVLATQKCGQIESILAKHFIPEIDRMLTRNVNSPASVVNKYHNTSQSGTVDFDYSNNDGQFRIGTGEWTFDTEWSKADNSAIHCYNDSSNISGIAIAIDAANIVDISDPTKYDFSSRSRTPQIGQIVVFKNKFNFYAAAKIKTIWDDTRGSTSDRLEFDFLILTNRSTDFSKA